MTMNLRLLLPFEIFAEKSDVLRIVVETPEGSLGLLPLRLDCVVPLEPGILTYETKVGGEVFVAVDTGVLVKSGPDVLVSVHQALGGTVLTQLRDVVEQQFRSFDQQATHMRNVMARLETGILRGFSDLQHD